MKKNSLHILPFLITGLTIFWLSAVAGEPKSVTVEDFLRKECNSGNQESCARLDELSASLKIQKRLAVRSHEFWKTIDTSQYMLGNKPNLQKVYEPVIRDFIKTEQQAGESITVKEYMLPQCSQHYHNFWINKKLWWPQNEDGTPDWPSIYEFIVDHYFGYCLRH